MVRNNPVIREFPPPFTEKSRNSEEESMLCPGSGLEKSDSSA
jgi:hypothetical protein